MDQVKSPSAVEQLFEPLEKQVQEGKADLKTFNSFYKTLKISNQRFLQILEFVYEENKSDKDWQRLYKSVTDDNLSNLMDRLRGRGYYYAKQKSIREIFEKQGYRLLEQTRAGKRDDVYYGLLRIFISLQLEFPQLLMEPFKPIHSDNMFKVLLFSFLSGVLGKEDINE